MKKLIGNAVVGQSGGPTAAINATLAGVIYGVLDSAVNDGSIKTLYGMYNGIEGFLEERMINLSERFEGKLEDIKTLENTPAAALGSCRKKLPPVDGNEDFYKGVFGLFEKYDIRYFFYIGGNDSMDTVSKLSEYSKRCDYDIRIIGVPKTIDNDLTATDHTPGFGSAAKYIATTLSEIIRDCAVYTKKAVTIVEIMGRDAGWLTAASAVGRVVNGVAPNLVYLPERAFNIDEFFEDLSAELDKQPNVVVAVSEGIRFADGRYVCEGVEGGNSERVDVFGHKSLSGTARALEMAVKERLGCKTRSVELNISQRCASHIASETDLCESVDVGRSAVGAALAGYSCEMMTIVRTSNYPNYSYEISHSSISDIANAVRSVYPEFINERGNNVTDECCEYILPLISGERSLEYRHGLPVHIIL